MLKWNIFSFLIIISWSSLWSQKEVTTISGQKLMILSDGSWEKLSLEEQMSDSTGMLINDLNPMISPTADAMSESQLMHLADIRMAAQTKEIEAYLEVDKLDKSMAINTIAVSQAKFAKDKQKEKSLKNEQKALKKKLVAASKAYESIGNHLREMEVIKSLQLSDQKSKMNHFAEIYQVPNIVTTTNNIDTIHSEPIKESHKKTKDSKVTDCGIFSDLVINKQRTIITNRAYFFDYTPEKLKNYFKAKELMHVSVQTLKSGKQQYELVVHIKIISKDAAKNYGTIQKGNMLKIQFISGKSAVLYAKEDVTSTIENYTGHSNYTIHYPIKKDEIDTFSNVSIDMLGIMWSSGYESYDIYQVDAIMKQLDCIKSVTN